MNFGGGKAGMNPNKDIYITPDEYEKLQETFNYKTEYDDGKIIMHWDTSDYHNEIVGNIAAYLKIYLKGSNCKVRIEQIEVIFDESHKYKPDVFVVCEESSMKGQSYTSVPKIIFEVISKSTASHDRITKLDIYQKHGVTEYNMVEQNGNIIQCTLKDDYYSINTYHKGDVYKSFVFPQLEIDLEDIF